jgi:hypothetical protein
VKWEEMTERQKRDFLDWTEEEIKRLEAGGEVPNCFDGTPEEMIASLKAERDGYLEQERAS